MRELSQLCACFPLGLGDLVRKLMIPGRARASPAHPVCVCRMAPAGTWLCPCCPACSAWEVIPAVAQGWGPPLSHLPECG